MPDLSILRPFNGKPPIAERVKEHLNWPEDDDITYMGDEQSTMLYSCSPAPKLLTFSAAAAIVECAVREWFDRIEASGRASFQYASGKWSVVYAIAIEKDPATFDSITAAAHWVADREGL